MNRIAIIDTQTRTVLRIFPVSGQYPVGIAVANNRAFVNAPGRFPPQGPGTVSVVDLTTGAEVAVLTVGTSPQVVIVTQDQSTVYVANSYGSEPGISVIETSLAEVRETIGLESPTNFALKPDGSTLYAVTRGTQIAAIQNNRVTDRIDLQQGLSAIAYYSQATGEDLLLAAGAGQILAVDLARDAVAFTIDGTGIALSMAVDPRVGRVYWGTEVAGALGVADLAAHEVIRVIDLEPPIHLDFNVLAVALSRDGEFAYATGPRSGVYVVDLQRLDVTDFIPLPAEANGVYGLTVADCPPGVTPPTPQPTATPTATPIACVGDCNNHGGVTVDDIVTMTNVALGDTSVSVCHAGDANRNGTITIDEILVAVRHALVGCRGDCRDGTCSPGTTCECCCGSWECLPPGTFCCALACTH